MIKSNKKLIFPFNYEVYPLAIKMMKDSNLIVSSNLGSGLIHKDIAVSINRQLNGIKVENIEDIDLNEISELIIANCKNFSLYDGWETLLQTAHKKNINVNILSDFIKDNLNLKHQKISNEKYLYPISDISKPIIYIFQVYLKIYIIVLF